MRHRSDIVVAIGLAAVLAVAVAAKPAKPVAVTKAARDSLTVTYLTDRNDTEKSMRTSPQSSLGAFARADFKADTRWLVVGSAPTAALQLDDGSVRPQHVRVEVEGQGFRVEALDPGATFVPYALGGRDTTVASVPPSWIGVGRYRVRLSYQNAPALIAVDPDISKRASWKGNTWWPIDLGYRYVVALTPDDAPDTVRIVSTHGPPRPSVRVGWFDFEVKGKAQRLAALRLLEPGVGESDLSVFFRDATSGKGSYGMGRYIDPERLPDGRWVLDFNLAYNPACAVSPYYNCPIPPAENELKAAIKAGQAYREEGHP